MKKKDMEFLKEQQNLVNTRLLYALGFDVGEDGYLRDQDTLEIVNFLNRPLRLSAIMHSRDIAFDPIHNRKLADGIFKIFLKKEQEDNGLYCKIFSEQTLYSDNNIQSTRLVLDTSEGIINTNYWYSDTLKFIEAILTITYQIDGIYLDIFDREFLERK